MIEEENKTKCPIELVQKVVGGKWKIAIIWALTEKTRRFNELQRLFPDITQTMLTKQLRDLEKYNFVHRKVYNEVPPKVEYSLTDLGRDFYPVVEQMSEWAKRNYDELNNNFLQD